MRSKPAREAPAPRSAQSRDGAAAGRGLRLTPGLYVLQTQPGFEAVALEEAAALAGASLKADGASGRARNAVAFKAVGRRTVPRRSGMALIRLARPEALAFGRTFEDAFALVGYCAVAQQGRAALLKVQSAASDAAFIDRALATKGRLSPGGRAGHRLRFRVVARLAGRTDFLRRDLRRAVEDGICRRADRAWRMVEERPDVEFWATMLGEEFFLALRLSGPHAQRSESLAVQRPAALRPSVGAALAWLSNPAPDDVVLDPMCGTGSLMIERARLGRYAMLLGGDLAPQAVAAARANLGHRYKPCGLARWDARQLPLRDQSVSKLLCNLPWGLTHGTAADNRLLYPALLQEFIRVLQPGGRMVLLTTEGSLMRKLWSSRLLTPERLLHVTILGRPAQVYALRR